MQLASCTEATSDLIADRQPFSRNPVRDCDNIPPIKATVDLVGVDVSFPPFFQLSLEETYRQNLDEVSLVRSTSIWASLVWLAEIV